MSVLSPFAQNTSRYVKLVHENHLHNGLLLQPGLNVDPIPFQTSRPCAAGGIYFTKLDYVAEWINSRTLRYLYEVEIPDGAQIWEESGNKIKADQIVLRPDPINLWVSCEFSKKMYLSAVQHNGYAIRCIPELFCTQELCLLAVQREGRAICCIPRSLCTKELCLVAVQQNWRSISYVPQVFCAMEMCLAAVQQNGLALQYVPQVLCTPEICLAAVQQEGLALQYVPQVFCTPEMYLAAVQQNGFAMLCVPKVLRTKELYLAAGHRDAAFNYQLQNEEQSITH